jgi:hypothetical protein
MSDLYEQDFIGWTEQQARLLRQAAAAGSNLGLDWANLIEEVESLGRSEYRALASQVRRIMLHLLKLEFSTATNPRAGWEESVADARAEISSLLRSDPGLRPRLAGIIADEAPRAAKLAVAALRAHGEDPAALIACQRGGATHTQDQILGDWLPERPDLS